jgi:cutinase
VRATRRQTRVLTLVTTGLLAFAAAAIPAQAMAAPRTTEAPSTQHCNNVEFIGARGSGQHYTGKGSFGGLGPEVSKMVGVIKAQLKKKHFTYGTDADPYPAVSDSVLIPSAAEVAEILMGDPTTYVDDNLDKFIGSISTGVDDAITDMNDYHELCGATLFVLAGYSQGAMVMHTVQNDLNSHSAVFKKIAGTLLLADGFRAPNTKAHQFGTSKKGGEGIVPWLLGPGNDVSLPKTTANICDANDFVCDTTRDTWIHISGDLKIHDGYTHCDSKWQCTSQKVLTTASTWVGDLVIKRLG